ncbi:MAG: co-chaperone GroES, partial [Candidatus Paceibacterota bacterium]
SVKIKPLADRVLVREEKKDKKEQKTDAGIIIPEAAQDNDAHGANRGEVVAVGEGKREDGELQPVPVSVGDTVLFSWGEKLTIDGEDYQLVDAGNILAIVQ